LFKKKFIADTNKLNEPIDNPNKQKSALLTDSVSS